MDDQKRTVAEVLQQSLHKSLGVQVQIVRKDFKTYLDALSQRHWDLAFEKALERATPSALSSAQDLLERRSALVAPLYFENVLFRKLELR